MSRKRFAEEFKIEAVRQITERGFAGRDVAERLGVSPNSLYAWIKPFGLPAQKHVQQQDLGAEIRRLQARLKRERVRRRIYANRDDARQDIFDYIEMFYNPVRRQGHHDGLSTVKYEM